MTDFDAGLPGCPGNETDSGIDQDRANPPRTSHPPLIVAKFGGTSVADISRIRNVADRIKYHRQHGNNVIAVVSAMGHETDRLLDLVRTITDCPDNRELDMLLTTGERITMALLAITLNDCGVPAISFTGSQSGIITDTKHTRAKIVTIHANRIEAELSQGKVVVVAGFQGVSQKKEVTTLGRGGSDTTAVALAAALGATRCEIYTDVPGVFAVDPRLRESAAWVPVISFDEMIELAGAGSQIMETRSVLFAKRYNLPLWIGSLMYQAEGTIVNSQGEQSARPVLGVALSKEETVFSLIGLASYHSVITEILSELADNNVPLEILFQCFGRNAQNCFSIIVPDAESSRVKHAIETSGHAHHIGQIVTWDNLARVSIIGKGMKGVPGITVKMLSALNKMRVPVFIMSTSDVRISAYIPRHVGALAVNLVADAFGLD